MTSTAPTDLGPLWRPFRLGAVTVPNRILISSHNTAHADDQLAAYLAARMAGGPGLIVMGGVPVHPGSMSNPTFVPAWQPEAVPRLAAIVRTVTAAGDGLFFCQIFHGGPNDPGNSVFGHPHAGVAPSAVAAPPAGRIPRAATQADIDEITAGFGDTARHVQQAGFDGVEISGGHGYLVHAFLSPTTNRRTDGYGGTPANRARFALEVGAAIRARCGPDFPVILRLSLDERLGPAGMTPSNSAELLKVLGGSGLFDAVSITGGVYATLDETVAPASAERDAVFLDSARTARTVLGPDVPLLLAGSVMDLSRAAELVAAGDADLVAMTRAQIADPDLVRKGRAGLLAEVRHCVRGNQGCWRGIKTRNGVTCTVNPAAGRESTWGPVVPAPEPRRVLVVGGGPAGLKAAVTALQRGHRVTLLERAAELGGQLRYAAALPGRTSWRHAYDDLAAALARGGATVRLGVHADLHTIREEAPDVVVLATGAVWETDGWSYHRAHEAPPTIAPDAVVVGPTAAMDDPDALGRRVAVLDDTGSYAPLGLAELLADRGAEVTVLTPRGVLGDHTVLTGEATFLMPRLLRKGVAMQTLTAVRAIDRSGLDVVSTATGQTRRIEADSVVTCLLRTPADDRDGLAAQLEEAGLAVHRIGDALAPREADDAFLEAEQLARIL